MASPKVSVIIPVYNTAGYLARCLKSVCGQTLRDIEIICIDDGSTDDSLTILRKWRNSDCRIRLIEMGENRGAAAARNAGIAIAQGDFLGFVDSDDFIDLDYYEKLINEAERTSADIVRAICICIDSFNMQDFRKCQIIEKNINIINFENERNELFKKNRLLFCYGFTTCIIRKSVVCAHDILFPEGINNFEDVVFLIKSVYYANFICTVSDVYYYYCLVENSNSRSYNYNRILKNIIYNSRLIMNFLNAHKYDDDSYIHISKYIIESIEYIRKKMGCETLFTERIRSLLKMNKLLYNNKEILTYFTSLYLIQETQEKVSYECKKGGNMPISVSVIVPVWNSEPWLADCLDSICGQTLQNIEIICINDASTDNSESILQLYAKKDSRINFINLSQNVGEGVARNIALEVASGEYVGFVDSDDSISPFFFKKLYDDAMETGADIARGYFRAYGIDGSVKENKEVLTSIQRDKSYFLSGFWTAIYKLSFLKSWNINFEPYVLRSADTAFLLRSVAACNFVSVNDCAIYNYMRRENRADSIVLTLEKITDPFKAFNTVISFLNKNNFGETIYNMQIAYMIYLCIDSARRATSIEKAIATRLCADKIIEIYGLCNDKKSFSSFIKRGDYTNYKIIDDILPALSNGDKRQIELYILSPDHKKNLQNVRKQFIKNNRDDI